MPKPPKKPFIPRSKGKRKPTPPKLPGMRPKQQVAAPRTFELRFARVRPTKNHLRDQFAVEYFDDHLGRILCTNSECFQPPDQPFKCDFVSANTLPPEVFKQLLTLVDHALRPDF